MTGHGIGSSAACVFADAGSDNHGDRQRSNSSHSVDYTGAREVTIAVTQAEVSAQLREPSATPRPIGEQGIGDRSQEDRGNGEGCILPAFGRRSSHDRESGVHEHHLEQEEHHHGHIVRRTAQEKAMLPKDAPRLPEQCDRVFRVERIRTAQSG